VHEKSVELLNQALADELQAIHQYMYFHFHCDDQGYDPLATLFKQTAMAEMRHAERISERVLFLKGDVEMKPNAPVEKIQDVAAMLESAKQGEIEAVKMYNDFAKRCGDQGDSVTKKLFEDLVGDEEGHFDAFDTQEEHLRKFGEQFLALQSIQRSQSAGGPPAE